MNFVQAIRRFILTSWLVAAPLVVVALLVGTFALLGIVQAIIGRVWGAEAAENFIADAMVLLAMAFELALLGLAAYGVFRVGRWLVGRKKS